MSPRQPLEPLSPGRVGPHPSHVCSPGQAEKVATGLKAGGGFDFSKMGEMMAGMGGASAAGGGAASEIEKLRRENAMLKTRMGMRDEL